jgi:3-oxosteroid 1-dehydrogenase
MASAEHDVVVVGSGAAALGAAATAAASGLSTLIVEKSRYWGGTTAYSGGGMWIPANPLLVADGYPDSVEEGRRYLDEIVGDVGPCSSPERRAAFLENGPPAISFLISKGLRVQRTPRYPDYYPEKPGGKIGRQLEPSVFDGRALGPLLTTLRRPPGAPPYLIQIDDFDRLTMPFRTVSGFLRGARMMARTASRRIRPGAPLTLGTALVAQLMAIATRNGTEVWLESPLQEIVFEGGRVTGVVVERGGERVQVRARCGVVLAAGGFARNAEMRQRHQSVSGEWSSAVGADKGDAIVAATGLGAALALMDDAWWGASFIVEGGAAGFCLWE